MSINSPKLAEHLENNECKLPDGEILRLYESLGSDEHKNAFKSYCLDKLQRDPWAQSIIELEICTNAKAQRIIKGNDEYTLKIAEAGKLAANDKVFDLSSYSENRNRA